MDGKMKPTDSLRRRSETSLGSNIASRVALDNETPVICPGSHPDVTRTHPSQHRRSARSRTWARGNER